MQLIKPIQILKQLKMKINNKLKALIKLQSASMYELNTLNKISFFKGC